MLHITITCNQVIHFFYYIYTYYILSSNQPIQDSKVKSLSLSYKAGKILKFKKGWAKIGLWIPLKDFFSNKTVLKFKKGWEKIGLWIPLFDFVQVRNVKIKKTSFF